MTLSSSCSIARVGVGFVDWAAAAEQNRAAEYAAFIALTAEADRILLYGKRADREPDASTPAGRALAILGPYLAACPLYAAGRPALPPPRTYRT